MLNMVPWRYAQWIQNLEAYLQYEIAANKEDLEKSYDQQQNSRIRSSNKQKESVLEKEKRKGNSGTKQKRTITKPRLSARTKRGGASKT